MAPLLLGAVLTARSSEGTVSLRITELEAYLGVGEDPGSHAHRGATPRTQSMFGEPGHLYVYFTYGMHACANIVCAPSGRASGLLLRAGEIVAGAPLARSRRSTARSDAELARGPARLTKALAITLDDDGAPLGGVIPGAADAHSSSVRFSLEWLGPPAAVLQGPRTGVSGIGGGEEYPWRFWLPGESSVSPYRAHAPRRR